MLIISYCNYTGCIQLDSNLMLKMKFFNDDQALPVMFNSAVHLLAEKLINILLHPNKKESVTFNLELLLLLPLLLLMLTMLILWICLLMIWVHGKLMEQRQIFLNFEQRLS